MQNIRSEVAQLALLGPFPPEAEGLPDRVRQYGELYQAIRRPVSDDEARVLIKLFGQDGYFGLASSLMHLIETAPGWPLMDCLGDVGNEWVDALRQRALRGGQA
ncbi:hypothetical protein [Massilia sp. YIM B04103]|uniref:hypothetical protein n=1 Tax=Massilia sp. YIM B04103 TaxID=2963106 RepID=UPI002109538A|nr:hypothetical protein [Massilia sp. YIM B04103]